MTEQYILPYSLPKRLLNRAAIFLSMNIIVTGGAGFIGSHLTDALITSGHRVTVIDNLSSGRKENVNPKAGFSKADVTGKEIEKAILEPIDTIFHFAAHISVRQSILNPGHDAHQNIFGSLNVLECARRRGVKKIIFASSGGGVYGNADLIPTPEKSQIAPLSPYGMSKYAVELYLEQYFRLYGIEYSALRFANVYGPRQDPNGEAGVVAIFAGKLLSREPCLIYGEGKQTRDYIYAADCVEACVKAMQKRTKNRTFNIGTGRETSVNELFDSINRIIGESGRSKHAPAVPGEVRRSALLCDRAEDELAWKAKTKLEEGLRMTIDWFKLTGK